MAHPHHAAFESFSVSAALIVLALVYARGWVRIRRLGLATIEGWRSASFLIALFFIWVAVASPIAALDHELLTVHMVQHLLLMTLAAPLLWLSTPLKPLLHGLSQRFAEMLFSRFHCSTPVQRMRRTIAQPAVCWLAAAGTLVGWHVPAAFMLGLRSEAWHTIEQASFLTAGLLFWWPVVHSRPRAPSGSEWSILVYLFLATLPCDILSAFLAFCDRVIYPIYLSTPKHFGISALADQQCAGALMWTCVTIVYLLAAAIVATRLLSVRGTHENELRKPDLPATVAPSSAQQRVGVA